MDIEILKDVEDKFKNQYLNQIKEKFSFNTIFENLKLKVVYKSKQIENPLPWERLGEQMFFTEGSYWFQGIYFLYDGEQYLGEFTLSCFPNCCGVCIMTANYNSYFEKYADFVIRFALILAQTGNYKEVLVTDVVNGSNTKAYKKVGFNQLKEFQGKGRNALVFLEYNICKSNELNILKEFKEIYEKKETNNNVEASDKEQASKPQTTEKLVEALPF